MFAAGVGGGVSPRVVRQPPTRRIERNARGGGGGKKSDQGFSSRTSLPPDLSLVPTTHVAQSDWAGPDDLEETGDRTGGQAAEAFARTRATRPHASADTPANPRDKMFRVDSSSASSGSTRSVPQRVVEDRQGLPTGYFMPRRTPILIGLAPSFRFASGTNRYRTGRRGCRHGLGRRLGGRLGLACCRRSYFACQQFPTVFQPRFPSGVG